MKWCRFQAGDEATFGIIEEDTVIAVSGNPFDAYTKTSTCGVKIFQCFALP
jgi:hypothetical protein